jgi:putative ABC transport system permease protein
MDRFRQDIRIAIRSLIRNPIVSGAAILSLGLGIGANASIFSAVDVFLFRPLEFRDADRLIVAWTTNSERGWTQASTSVPDYLDLRERSRSAELAAWGWSGVNLSGIETPERLSGYIVTSNFFDVLGKSPVLGRGFTLEEERSSGSRVVILGDGVWQRRFGADPSVIGRVVNLDGAPHEIIGVMPPRVRFGTDPDVWLPIRFTGQESRGSHWLNVLGRIRSGYGMEQVRTELNTIQQSLAGEYPATNAGKGASVLTLQQDWFDEGFRQGSLIAGSAVLFVLLIACANVANLLLARAASREREIALRGALGAGRIRIVRQMLTESMILSTAGGGLGALLAIIGVRGLKSVFPPDLTGIESVALNGRVLAYTGGLVVLSALLFGLAPAIRSARLNLRDLLTDGGRGNTVTRGARARTGLIIAEVSLSLVLLVASALMVQAFVKLRTAELGFRTQDVVTLGVVLPAGRYPDAAQVVAFQTQLLDRIAALPGVESVGAADRLPLTGNSSSTYTLPDEAQQPEAGREPTVSVRMITPGYLEALDIEPVSGRVFSASDAADAPRVVLVNELMVARHWPGQSPIGRRIRLGGQDHEIIGVVETTRDWGPEDEPGPMAYLALLQREVRTLTLAVHTAVAPEALFESIRDAVRSIDPEQPVYALNTMEAIALNDMMGSIAMAKVLGALALIAFILSAVGVYGVMAHSVAQRTLEMGIRMALGAQRGSVRSLVLRRGALITGAGIVIGLVISLGVTRLLSFFLFGVSPYDPVAFSSVSLLLAATGLFASWLPAVRATRVDPIKALRTE